MFWDGERWVERKSESHSNSSNHQRLRSRLATVPIILLIPALMLPTFGAGASSSTHVTSPSSSGNGRAKAIGHPSLAPSATPSLVAEASSQPAAVPTPIPTIAATPIPTPIPTTAATPVRVTPPPTQTPAPTPAPTSTPTPTSSTTVVTARVSSVAGILSALADNTVDVIVVANGTYRVSAASSQASNSLWIGPKFASRTNPVVVRAETVGGVTFDGGGTGSFGCISFEGGVHDQMWDGFTCANGTADSTGVITFGGYPTLAGSPNHITLNHFRITSTCRGSATSASSATTDHAIYMSEAAGAGPNHILFQDLTIDGRGGLASAFHFFHSAAGVPNASYVTVRRMHVTGTQQAIILWDSTLTNILFDGVDITGALKFGVRYESTGASGITFRNVATMSSGQAGWYSSQGPSPAGVSLSGNSWN